MALRHMKKNRGIQFNVPAPVTPVCIGEEAAFASASLNVLTVLVHDKKETQVTQPDARHCALTDFGLDACGDISYINVLINGMNKNEMK
jgi:hypothetical protein